MTNETKTSANEADAQARINTLAWLITFTQGAAVPQTEDILAGFVDGGGADALDEDLAGLLTACVDRGRELCAVAAEATALLRDLLGHEEARVLRDRMAAGERHKAQAINNLMVHKINAETARLQAEDNAATKERIALTKRNTARMLKDLDDEGTT